MRGIGRHEMGIWAEFIITEPFEEFEVLRGQVLPPRLWKPWVFWFESEDGRRFWIPAGAWITFRRRGEVSSLFGRPGSFKFSGICLLRKME